MQIMNLPRERKSRWCGMVWVKLVTGKLSRVFEVLHYCCLFVRVVSNTTTIIWFEHAFFGLWISSVNFPSAFACLQLTNDCSFLKRGIWQSSNHLFPNQQALTWPLHSLVAFLLSETWLSLIHLHCRILNVSEESAINDQFRQSRKFLLE